MGCGASKVAPQSREELEDKPKQDVNGKQGSHESKSNGHAGRSPDTAKSDRIDSETQPNNLEANGNVQPEQGNEISNDVALNHDQDTSFRRPEAISDDSSSRTGNSAPLSPVAKGVAFEIAAGEKDVENRPSSQKPPRRLKKMESAPTLTREALEKKLAVAEQNRQKELEKKAKVVSKRRSELFLAREMDKAQQQKTELEEKLAASDKKREKAKAEVVAKQKRREEKARRVRKTALQIKEGGDVVNVAVDRDETYNADEEDESWDIGTPVSRSSSVGHSDHNNNDIDDNQQSSQAEKQSQSALQNEDTNAVHDFFDS